MTNGKDASERLTLVFPDTQRLFNIILSLATLCAFLGAKVSVGHGVPSMALYERSFSRRVDPNVEGISFASPPECVPLSSVSGEDVPSDIAPSLMRVSLLSLALPLQAEQEVRPEGLLSMR